jgi:thioredoxin reductase
VHSLPFATSTSGIFAFGDVRSRSIKRVQAAVGKGAAVIQTVHQFLEPRGVEHCWHLRPARNGPKHP